MPCTSLNRTPSVLKYSICSQVSHCIYGLLYYIPCLPINLSMRSPLPHLFLRRALLQLKQAFIVCLLLLLTW